MSFYNILQKPGCFIKEIFLNLDAQHDVDYLRHGCQPSPLTSHQRWADNKEQDICQIQRVPETRIQFNSGDFIIFDRLQPHWG